MSAGTSPPLLLEVEGLELGYGPVGVVRDLSFGVAEGSVVCLIGANGAGKTTVLRGLSGLIRPRAGRVCFAGREITGWPAHRIAAAGLCQVPEGRQIFARMSVAENLRLGALQLSDPATRAARLDEVLARFAHLTPRLDQPAGQLSGGEQQMLAIGRALMGAPRLLLLDEPSMGLAPLLVEEIFRIIARMKGARTEGARTEGDGVTFLLVEQNASAALEIADHAYVLENGRITLSGPGPEIARDPKVAAAYLGGS